PHTYGIPCSASPTSACDHSTISMCPRPFWSSVSLPRQAVLRDPSRPKTGKGDANDSPRDMAGKSGEARAFLRAALDGCPVADDAVLCVSEWGANAVLHSDSRKAGGTFTVRAEV